MVKLIVIIGIVIMLCCGVTYSLYPTTHYSNGEIGFDRTPSNPPIKEKISVDDYNKIFSDYRDGILPKEDASIRLREVEILR